MQHACLPLIKIFCSVSEVDVAKLEYELMAGEYGLVVRVNGYNHKLLGSPNITLSKAQQIIP